MQVCPVKITALAVAGTGCAQAGDHQLIELGTCQGSYANLESAQPGW